VQITDIHCHIVQVPPSVPIAAYFVHKKTVARFPLVKYIRLEHSSCSVDWSVF